MSLTLRDEAQAILDHCGPDTSRDHLVWAAGTVICDKAFYFAEFPILADKLPGWGWPGCNGRMFNCTRAGVHIYANTTMRPDILPPVRWAEIADLATLDRIGHPLHRRILDHLAVREAHQALPFTFDRRPSWHELMDESQALAAQVWARCRPGVTVQLDLLDLVPAGA